MRTDNRFLVLSTLGGLLTAASCTLITDVDRTKIPVDGGTPAEGGQGANGGSGGKAGSGGKGGTAGRGGGGAGTGGSSGGAQGGEAGGGEAGATGGTAGATGGTSGTGGSSGTGGTDAGAGGEAGASAMCGNGSVESGEACDDGNISVCGTCSASCDATRTIPAGSEGALGIGALTFFMDGDTFTLDDGTNPATVFEFECGPPDCTSGTTGVASGNQAIAFTATNFDGVDDEAEYRVLVVDAINLVSGAGDLLTTAAAVGGSPPAFIALENVEVITDTVGNPNFVTSQRCTAGLGCASDLDCLSGSCDTTAQTCD